MHNKLTASDNCSYEFIECGYFITTLCKRTSYNNEKLVPLNYISLSECVASFIPSNWTLTWCNPSDEEVKKCAAIFGIDESLLTLLSEWSTQNFETEWGWPNIWYSLDFARNFTKRFMPHNKAIIIGGISLDIAFVDNFLLEAASTTGALGMVQICSKRHILAPTKGTCIGYDILGFDQYSFHSYLCNGLEDCFHVKNGATPNKYGLFSDYKVAKQCAEHANLESTGAEPGLWLPWRITLY